MAFLRDTGTGTEFKLEKRTTVIGREEDCDIVFGSRLVSHQHARVRRGLFGYSIVDAGSANGTYVNDERLKGRQRLQSGDAIIVGKAHDEAPKSGSQDPDAKSPGWGLKHRPAPGEIKRGDFRIGAELIFHA